MTAAIVIARGGSKRLPRKNVKLMCGHPLVAWSIIQADCSHLIDEVYLTTDDDEIAAIGEAYGAKVIRRPDWPDADEASGQRPTVHAIGVIKEEYGDEFDLLVSVLPTMPCRFPNDLDRAVQRYNEDDCEDARPMGRPRETLVFFEYKPEYCLAKLTTADTRYLCNGGSNAVISPKEYLKNYDASTDTDAYIRQSRGEPDNYYGSGWHRAFVEVQPWQGQDCDVLEEFEFCELLLEHYILKGRGAQIYYDYGASK